MCGIAGVFCYKGDVSLDESIGLQMTNSLSHRGPDDGGLVVADNMLLGHRRLSILDLSDEGHQPMSTEDGRYWIAYNGEVYNYRELRLELESAGHVFRSQTDTEVVLRGYVQWQEKVASKLNGMFAFALWDRFEQSLWLARDSIGIKPLFYHDDGQCIRFGSEIKAILADPAITRIPDRAALHSLLTFGYMVAPQTGFAGVRQLLPGTSLQISRNKLQHQTWYQLPYPSSPPKTKRIDAAEQLETAFQAAVERQMVSDVNLGGLLSGGLDSSAIVRSMQRTPASPVDTFTIGFQEDSFDESIYAEQVANILKTRHHHDTVAADVASLLSVVVSHAEEPLADNSALPFYLLSKFTRQHVTVALSGDGADELLAGYDTYRASQMAPLYRKIPGVIRRRLIEPLVERLPNSKKKYGWPMLVRRFVNGARQPALRDHCSWRRIVSDSLRRRLYSDQFLHESDEWDPIGDYTATLADAPDWLTPLDQQLHMDLKFHLPNDMLVKVDRMSMSHSLEIRVPFLDEEVIRACLAMSPECKRQGKRGKLALKQMLANDLPDNIVYRRKAGFLLPLEAWMSKDWQPFLRDTLNDAFLNECQLFDPQQVRNLMDEQASGRGDHAYPLFVMLTLAMWWKIWISQQIKPALNRVKSAPTAIRRLLPIKGEL